MKNSTFNWFYVPAMVLLVSFILTSGCSIGPRETPSNLGKADYELEIPIQMPDGSIEMARAEVFNTKNYKSFKFKYMKDENGLWSLSLEEEGVDSSTPAQVGAEAQAEMARSNSALAKTLETAINALIQVP